MQKPEPTPAKVPVHTNFHQFKPKITADFFYELLTFQFLNMERTKSNLQQELSKLLDFRER